MKRCLLLIASVSMISGCATITPINTSLVSYSASQFSFSDLHNSSIAVLPVITSMTKYEGFKRPAGDAIARSIQNRYSDITVHPPIVTLANINDANLSADYSNMMLSYVQTGILNRDTIKQIATASNSRFLLYSKLGAEETRETDYDPTLGVTTTRVLEFEIYSQLWDATVGDIVWEGRGGAAYLSSKTTLNGLLTLAAQNLAAQIGRTPHEVPAPQSVTEMHNQARTNIYGAALGVSAVLLILVYAISPPPFI